MLTWDWMHLQETTAEEGTYKFESEFDAVSSATTTVSIIPSNFEELSEPVPRTDENLTNDQIAEMVKKAIEIQGGFDGIINKGNEVLIKVNLVGSNKPAGSGENTDYRVVKGLILVINEFTEGDIKIIIAEGTARTNDDPDIDGSVWHNSGYVDLLSDADLSGIDVSLLNLNQSYSDLVEVDLKNDATAAPHGGIYRVHKAEFEADVYISVPVLKIHNTGITCALKNQIGTAPGSYYGYNKMKGSEYYNGLVHDVNQRRWTTEEIVDLCNISDIDFVVVDALMCLESYKSDNGSNRVRMNTVLAGADPVAVDHVCAKLFCLNPDDIAHITLAEKIGLGTNQRDKIWVKGAAISDVKKKVKKNTDPEGEFGQSNRTWIISQSFSGTDIEMEYIPDEASLNPRPKDEGWSEPVYFFDDRIDLLSYFDSKNNIVSYAFSYFDAPKTQTAELWIGSDEAMWIYINEELVYDFSSITSFNDGTLLTDIVDINIKEGENRLLVKTLQKFGDYSFTLNICDPESDEQYAGNRVEGLMFYQDSTWGGSSSTIRESHTQDNHKNNLTVYPNPCSEMVHINFKSGRMQNLNIQVFDLSGKLVKDFNKPDIIWNLTDNQGNKLKGGQYIVRENTSSSVIKLIVE
jgi:uncharacterized protein (DUF362 family)